MKRMKHLLGSLLLMLLTVSAWTQSIWTNPITDTNPSASNPFTTGQTVNANITVSGIGRGPGLSANAGSNRYNATSWSLAAMDANDYFQFTLTPNAGYQINLTSFVYSGTKSGTGPGTYAFRSSVDGYAANIGAPGTSGSVSLTAAAYQNLTGAITFRFYGWGGSSAAGTFSIDDFTFNGTVVSAGCAAPTSQGSNIIFPTATTNSLDVNWTNGNGGGRVVMMNTTNSGFTAPTNGSNPTANTVYSGSGLQVIYNGTGSGPVTVTGLNPGTTYWFRVYEYCTPDRTYLTTGATTNGSTAAGNTITTAGAYGPFCNTIAGTANVTYTTTGTFTGTYTAQLSDATGNFSSPTVIGSGSASPIAVNIPTGLPAGTGYRIRVVNDIPAVNGANNGSNITISGLPVVNLGNDTAYCAGSPFNLTLNAGNAGATYTWNSGAATTQTFAVTTAGTYSVLVTNPGGCIAQDTLVVTQNTLPVVALGNDTAYCAGTPFNLTLDAGNAGASYNWNSGAATTQTFAVSTDGTYSVTATDANGCQATDALTVTENALPIVALGNDTAYCAGTTFNLTLNAGNAGATYDWNNGAANTQTVIADTADTYSVTVTDANGCENTDVLVVTENTLPVVALGNDTAYCVGTSFNLTLDAGNAGATYNWNNGAATTQTFAVTTDGTYSVTVTDANGCENTDTLTVTENALPIVALGIDTAHCAGTAFNLTLDAGNPGASYNWNNGAATTQTFTADTAGTYSVTVIDINGCQSTDNFTVVEFALPIVVLGNDTAYCAGTVFSITLDAGNTGTSFDWNNGAASTQTFTADSAGTYAVTVTDANGCENTDELIVTENALPVVDLEDDETFYCEGTALSLVLDAGNPGAAYNWNNGAANTQTFTATAAGTYTVTVTDVNGCINSDSTVITEKPLPTVTLGNDTAYCAGSAFSWILDAGNAGASYSWNGGVATTQTFTATTAGTYTVNVTDVFGCSSSASVEVTENALPGINLGADVSTANSSYVLNAGSGFDSYLWTPGGQTTQQITVTQNGTYTVTVTSAEGCEASDAVLVTLNNTASISEAANQQPEIRMYPNPAREQLTVSLQYQGQLQVDIISINGKVLASQKLAYEPQQALSINLPSLSAGMYVVRFSGTNFTANRQLIIQQ